MNKSLLFSLDYDKTYTADPELWDMFMFMAEGRGHRFVCVTARALPPPMRCPVVCVPEGLKRVGAEKAGYKVDIWIDDMPGMIEQTKVLYFGG